MSAYVVYTIHHFFVSSTHACHSTYPVISKGAERGGLEVHRSRIPPLTFYTSSYLAVLGTEEQRRREKVAEGYGGFLKTEMHLNSDLFSGLSQREGANCPEERTDT